MPFPTHNETLVVADIIDDLRKAEYSRDLTRSLERFSELGWLIDIEPDFSIHNPWEEANLLRLAGTFISHYGFAKNLINYQERSKNIFTRAIELFERLEEHSSAIECQIQMASAYCFDGGISEADILHEISSVQIGDERDYLYLLLQVNSLEVLFNTDVSKGLEKITELESLMEKCSDLRLRSKFHNEAGMIYRKNGEFEKAEFHYLLSLKFKRNTEMPLGEALTLNNLACLYLRQKKFSLALEYSKQSIEIINSLKHSGWLPHFLDTKAQINFQMGDLEEARRLIHEAVMNFRRGEDYGGFCNSLILQAQILISLDDHDWALDSFAECLMTAKRHLPEKVGYYRRKLQSFFHFVNGQTFDEKIGNYTRDLLEAAFSKTKLLSEAASILGFANTARLRYLLNTQFPEMYRDFDLLTKGKPEFPDKPKIEQISLSSDYVFDFEADKTELMIFSVPEQYKLGSKIAVAETPKINPNKFVVYHDGGIGLGKLIKRNRNWVIEDDSGAHIDPDSVEFLGEVVGICRAGKVFKKLEDL